MNPWNCEDMAEILHQALTMSLTEREIRQLKLYRYVTTHSASFWAKSFLGDLQYACKRSAEITKLAKLPTRETLNVYQEARNRVIICDYDGTLTPFQALATTAAPKKHLKNILKTLASDPKNTVVVVSYREKAVVGQSFTGLNITIAAESGYFYKIPQDDECIAMGSDVDDSWREVVCPIMQYFTDRTPGSFIEKKETSLSWHYCNTETEFGTMQAGEMQVLIIIQPIKTLRYVF